LHVPKDTPAERRAKRDVGRRVAELRERAGLTQDQLAERMTFTVKYIQQVERGGYNLTIETLLKLAKALGTRWRELCRAPKSRARRRPGRPSKPAPRSAPAARDR
jgi:transcriptional regulator with XRE-family HTH domain